MLDAFVPLERYFRRPLHDESNLPVGSGSAALPADVVVTNVATAASADELDDAVADALSQTRRFRAALADAVDARVEQLLRDIACGVLARELALAPADVGAVIASALARYAAEEPVTLRAHPEDAWALHSFDFNVVADARLGRGDVAIDLRSGTIDASLVARLESVLAR